MGERAVKAHPGWLVRGTVWAQRRARGPLGGDCGEKNRIRDESTVLYGPDGEGEALYKRELLKNS